MTTIPLAPHQKHNRAKMRRHGWMNEEGQLLWPSNKEEREKMARGLFGLELISSVDYWTMSAEDELDNSFQKPWASPDQNLTPEETRRREIFKTLSREQREAVCELLREAMKGQLHSVCTQLDQRLGGSTILLEFPNDKFGEPLKIHSPAQDGLRYEQFDWLKDFSILFGKDERFETGDKQ